MNEQLLKKVAFTLEELQDELSTCDVSSFNQIPFKGSWTEGQLIEHLVLANGDFVNALESPVSETERDPGEMVEKIKADFLNYNIKFSSPDFIYPKEEFYEKEEQSRVLEKIKTDVTAAISRMDLSKTCLSIQVPVYGTLTRLEAVHLLLYHTQRHIHQLKNIKRELSQAVG